MAAQPPKADLAHVAESSLGMAQSLVGDADDRPIKVEVEHLDYGYIGKCTNGRELEKIYVTLKSGEYGRYPDLEEYTKKKIMQIKPKSLVIKETKKVKSLREVERDERARLASEMSAWTNDMASRERHRQVQTVAAGDADGRVDVHDDVTLPPVRGQKKTIPVHTTAPASTAQDASAGSQRPFGRSGKAIPGGDFRAWDKFDVDKACADVDADAGSMTTTTKSETTHINKEPSKLPPMSVARVPDNADARRSLALDEKAKGNECFRSGDHGEAVVYYSRSLSVEDTIVTRNNRALAFIKLGKFSKALVDLDVVLSSDPLNMKALLRRATALQGSQKWQDALGTAKKVLELQPGHKDATKIVQECQKKLGVAAPAKKKTRMVIEEVDGDDSSDEAPSEPAAPSASQTTPHSATRLPQPPTVSTGTEPTSTTSATTLTPKSRRIVIEEDSDDDEDDDDDEGNSGGTNNDTPAHSSQASSAVSGNPGEEKQMEDHNKDRAVNATPVDPPPNVVALKEAGNKHFAAGQYGAAVTSYTEAMDALALSGCDAPDALAAILSNRAGCHLKNGDCSQSVADCDAAIALDTALTAKVMLRRAAAQEAREKYGLAYDDYATLVHSFPGNTAAREGMGRCSKMLREQEGPSWRSKRGAPVSLRRTPPATSGSGPTTATATATPPTARSTKTPVQTGVVDTNTDTESEYDKHKTRGNNFVKAKNFAEAVACYTRAIALKPDAPAARNNRALCFLRQQKFVEALEDTTAVLHAEPGNIKAMFRKAQALVGMKQLGAARTVLETLLSLDANNSAAQRELADVQVRLRSDATASTTDDATTTLEAASAIDAELAAMRKKRAELEQARSQAERDLGSASAAVETASSKVSEMKSVLSGKQKELDQTTEKIKDSIAAVTKDVEDMAAAEAAAAAAQEHKKQDATKGNGARPDIVQARNARVSTPSRTGGGLPSQGTSAARQTADSPKKLSAADFMRTFNRVRKDNQGLSSLLGGVGSGQLPKLFSNRLEADHVLDMVRVLSELDAAHAVMVMRDVAAVKRFQMVKMFFSDDDMKQIKARTDALRSAVQQLDNGAALAEEVGKLQNDYLN